MERKKRKDATGRTTMVKSIRMPEELVKRIDTLAQKNMTNFNAWCIKALARVAKPKKGKQSP